jgi:HK97 gp10 family phage protein
MEIALHVDGCEQLAENMRLLAEDVRSKFTLRALKAGGAVVRDYAQALAPVRTGALATSIIVSTKGDKVLVGPDTGTYPKGENHDKRGMRHDSIGIMQERGTFNHFGFLGRRITAQQARRQKNKKVIIIGRQEVRMPKHEFMKPALEQAAQEAFEAEAYTLRSLIAERARSMGERI